MTNFSIHDLMAMGVLPEAKKAKIRIPEDISLVRFDDINSAALIDPLLSTVRQPLFDMGCKATEILFNKIKNPMCDCEIKIFPVELVPRKSIV